LDSVSAKEFLFVYGNCSDEILSFEKCFPFGISSFQVSQYFSALIGCAIWTLIWLTVAISIKATTAVIVIERPPQAVLWSNQ